MTARQDRLRARNAEMADRYNDGEPVRALAAAYGLSYGAAHRALERAGVTFRPRGRKGRAGGAR